MVRFSKPDRHVYLSIIAYLCTQNIVDILLKVYNKLLNDNYCQVWLKRRRFLLKLTKKMTHDRRHVKRKGHLAHWARLSKNRPKHKNITLTNDPRK